MAASAKLRNVRIAIVQLRCHPAVIVDGDDYLNHPFFDESNDNSFSDFFKLLDHKNRLSQDIRNRYLTWHESRVKGILAWLANLAVPDVVVFPEGSLPLSTLSIVHRFAKATGAIVFAGTHSYQSLSQSRKQYRALGVQPHQLKELDDQQLLVQNLSVLPIVTSKAIELRPKLALSLGERRAFQAMPPDIDVPVAPITFKCGGGQISVIPFVCAEWLQNRAFSTAHDDIPLLAIVCSFDADPNRFVARMEVFRDQNIPVVYCNDGAYGGSRFFSAVEKHTPSQFLESPYSGPSPAGDLVHIVEWDRQSSVLTGTAKPQPKCAEYVVTAAVVACVEASSDYKAATLLRQAHDAVTNTKSIRRRQTSKTKTPPEAAAALIREALSLGTISQLQRHKLGVLFDHASKGVGHKAAWHRFGQDCIVHDLTETLEYVEAESGTRVSQEATVVLDENPSENNALTTVLKVKTRCAPYSKAFLRFPREKTVTDKDATHALPVPESPSASFQPAESALDILNAATAHFQTIAVEVRDRALRELTDAIGALVERFDATSAWLFLADEPTRNLRTVAAHNTPTEPLTQSFDEGIVGLVASRRSGYMTNNCCEDRVYLRTIATTRSELAVPIFAPRVIVGASGIPTHIENELIAVLNLESTRSGAFLPVAIGELQAAASGLAANLRILQALDRNRGWFGWHPHLHGWGLTELLNNLCHRLALAISGDKVGSGVSCTVWHVDWPKQRLYVRGTARFDYEYEARNCLPLYSFTGEVVSLRRGECASALVIKGKYSDVHKFRRPLKANRMGVDTVLATPLFASEESESSAMGSLNVYLYTNQYGLQSQAVTKGLSDQILVRLASLVARMVQECKELRLQVAAAYLSARMLDESLAGITTIDLVRQTIMECLQSEACSIFCPDGDEMLACVSTSGLQGILQSEARQTATYSLRPQINKETAFVGLTRYLAEQRNACLRKNDVPDPDEILEGVSGKLVPENRYTESFALTSTDHRRFIGVSISDRQKLLAVVRLNRDSTSRPYTVADERLLQTLVAVSKREFVERRYRPRDLNALPAVASAFRFAFLWHRFDEGKIDETVFRAAARVLSPLGDGNLWNRRQVLAVLQDLVCVFGSYGAFLASVRHAVTDDSGDDFLRVYACHSAWSNLPPDEEEYPPVSKAGNAVGWEAIKQNCAITFDHACPWFRCIHSDSAKVKSGICVPLLTITPIGFVRGVLSLDFSSELRWTSDKVAVVFRAARKISAMGGPNIANDEARFVQITKPASLDAFLRRQAKKMNIAWGQIMLMRDGRLCPAAGVGTPPSEQQILRCIGEMRKHRLAPAQIEVRAYARRKMWAVPLFHGASEVGKIVAAVEEPFDIEATACRVGSLWSMFSNGPSKMRPSWDMRCERIDPQDYNVRGAQAWRCDASWIKE